VESERSISSSFESTLEAVDAAEGTVRRFAQDAGFDEDSVYFIGLASREILVNAVGHGNRFDSNKKVTLRLSLRGNRLTIEVLDEGDGFQLDSVPDPRLEENRERLSGRGIAMAVGIMDEFYAEKNVPNGTHIRMIKVLKTGPNPLHLH
jgi:serine/threonine-protein kinase RsbW